MRGDVEGLRAVAVVLVLLYHAGVAPLAGGFVGVDVFFVISGFLITGLLIREAESNGRISLSRFYARRAARLLPAAALVLAVTSVLTLLLVGVVDRRTFGVDIVAAALYVVNWRLADRSVDYLAEDVGASPVQHFWSLAVEEQFYLVWPLLVVAAIWWVRRRSRARLRPVLTAAILLVVLPSFAVSVWLTAADPATAFFVTPTRLWELGVGALLALGAQLWPRLPAAAASALSWAGLAAIAASGMLASTSTGWPGHHALGPVLGTAAVLVAGSRDVVPRSNRLLGWRPAVWVGGLSYSLYLWHWPLLVLAAAVWGDLSTVQGLLVVAVSVLPAWLGHRLVENPARFAPSMRRSARQPLLVGAGLTTVGVVAGLVVALSVPTTARPEGDAAGAAALSVGPGGGGTVASLADADWYVPSAVEAPEDVPAAYAEECQVDRTTAEPVLCEYGDLDGAVVLAVVGDSKMLQWESAIAATAADEGWRVVSITKSNCAFAAVEQVVDSEPYPSCTAWNEQTMAALLDLDPDLVLSSQYQPVGVDPETGEVTAAAMHAGLAGHWTTLREAGIAVGVVVDTPSPPFTVYECVAEEPDLADCTFDREEAIAASAAPTQLAAARQVADVGVLDLTDVACPAAECVPVIGNALVWRQTSHLTDTYVRTATPLLADQLVPLVDDAVSAGSG